MATTTLLADLAANVAGTRASVAALQQAGTAEDYQPRPEDTRQVSEADVLVLNGLGLDPWATPLFNGAGRAGAIRLTLSDGLPLIKDKDAPEGSGNPHLWFDVSNAKTYTEKLRDVLIEVDPADTETYRANQVAYVRQLDELDSWVRQQVAAVPESRRKLVTFEDAFPYFARAYGFQIVGFVTPDPGHEPSAGELADLVVRAKAAGVPAFFGQAEFSPKVVDALAHEAGVKVVNNLYTDSLGPAPANSYVGMMRYDVTNIVEALK